MIAGSTTKPSLAKALWSKFKAFQTRNPRTLGIIFWVVGIALAILIALLIRIFIFQTFYIELSSMEPTLKSGDRVVVNKLSYSTHSINRGDIVVLDRNIIFPDKPDQPDIIKRVIALPGEQVRIFDCQVYIDGLLLTEPYLGKTTYPQCADILTFENTEIPEGHIFVLGDNRQNSNDSRGFKSIPEEAVIGRAFVKFWPIWDINPL